MAAGHQQLSGRGGDLPRSPVRSRLRATWAEGRQARWLLRAEQGGVGSRRAGRGASQPEKACVRGTGPGREGPSVRVGGRASSGAPGAQGGIMGSRVFREALPVSLRSSSG